MSKDNSAMLKQSFVGRMLFLSLIIATTSLSAEPADPFSDGTPESAATTSVKDFGARGDGVADDTAAIQSAIDSVANQGGTLLFPPGNYLVTSVGLRPGVHYLGYGATITRPANQGKWVRSFDAAKQGYLYSGDEDSAMLTIEGLTFDGQRVTQDEYQKYQLEHAHLLFLQADPEQAGRLRARIVNCQFQDCVADAISLYTNVDVQIMNCTARDCFRGGITITGGHSRIQVVNFTAHGKVHPTGIDVEVDGAGFGGSYKIELTLNGLMLPDGDFDVAVFDGSVVLGTNIMARAPFNLYARDASVRISNSEFGIGRYSGGENRIVHPGDVTFQNCRFYIDGESSDEASTWAAIHVYWNLSQGQQQINQSLKLLDCDFEVGPGIAKQDTTYAVYCEGDVAERKNRLLVDGGRIPASFNYGVFINLGGTVCLRDVEIEAQTPMYFGSTDNWPIVALIDGVRVEEASRYAMIVTHGPDNRFTHRNVEIDESVNTIETSYGIAKNQYRGRRTILGDKPPTSATHGLLGDVYRLKTPAAGSTFEWICTQTGNGVGAVWSPSMKLE
ncbi:MAG TPA: glycosyl hydrolase family 28-related protein [Planctomycetaceae bacterium]|nr:glycosyl hydrolase family 28-related protein [Planctomycetaceae bacterium]HQZ65647.1 glycosyl hydrolase family 28-related protein [Planctomycetaceae bacterium]